MYIGPWQEYKLSQAQRQPQPLHQGITHGGNDIRHDLQQTLLQKLSPEDVAKVMAAMNPLLEGNGAGAGGEPGFLPPLPSGRRHHQQHVRARHQRLTAERQPPTLHEQFRLPSINTQYRTAAPSPGQNGTPQSVRSSKSEPLHSSHKTKRPIAEARAFSPPASSARTTGCSAANLVATLKLERKSRPTIHDAAKKADFGQFWGWKNGKSDSATSDTGAVVDTKKAKAEDALESKVARVRNMHKLYSMGGIEQCDLASESESPLSLDVSASPLRTYKKPQTPVIQDRDLTSNDLAVVSKYFAGQSSAPPFHPVTHQSRKSLPNPSKILSPKSTSPSGEDEELAVADDRNNIDYFSPRNHPTATATGRIICSPVQVMDTSGNYGSPEGLLHWTSMLNPDEIDSMY